MFFLMFKLVIFGVCEEHQRVDRIMKNYNKNNKIVSYNVYLFYLIDFL